MDKNIFDLDFQVNKMNGAQNAPQRITSKSFCTAGTCREGCDPEITFRSNWCSKSFCTPGCDKNR